MITMDKTVMQYIIMMMNKKKKKNKVIATKGVKKNMYFKRTLSIISRTVFLIKTLSGLNLFLIWKQIRTSFYVRFVIRKLMFAIFS